MKSRTRKLRMGMVGGGKGMLTVSQIAIGQENALRIRIYGSKAALEWDQGYGVYQQSS